MKLTGYLIREKMVPPFSTFTPSSGTTEHRKATKLCTIIFFKGGLVQYQIFLRTLPLKCRDNGTKVLLPIRISEASDWLTDQKRAFKGDNIFTSKSISSLSFQNKENIDSLD